MTRSNHCINWDIIDSLAEDDETMRSILATFIESFQNDLEKLTAAIAKKDSEQLDFLAHTLKGASSNFCKEEIVKELINIEAYIKIANFDDGLTYIEKLKTITQSIIEELQSALK